MNKGPIFFLMFFFWTVNAGAQTFQGASLAPNGTGRYKQQIYWVNWDTNLNGYPDETFAANLGTTISRSVDVPGGITYTITLTQKSSSSTLGSYVPGKWDWDDIKSGYNWFKNNTTPYNYRYYYDNTSQAVSGADKYNYGSNWEKAYNSITDAHNSVMGLINQNQYSSVNFNVKISGVYTGTNIAVPASFLKGLVICGAESLQGNGSAAFNANKEHYQLTNLSNNNPWRAIDTVLNKVPSGYAYYGAYSWAGYQSSGFTQAANVTTGSNPSVLLYNGSNSSPPAAPATPARPPNSNTTAVYFEGAGDVIWTADYATNVDVFFKGDGYTAIAIGFLYATDLGDAPLSYGTDVTNIQEINFSGGILSAGSDIYIKGKSLATRNAANLLIGTLIDEERNQLYSADLKGDDGDNLLDEDGLTAPGAVVNFIAGSTSQSIKVPVINSNASSAILMGWIDINENGQFEANESAVVNLSASGVATLSWNLPQAFKANTSYKLRLRLYEASSAYATDDPLTSVDERSIKGLSNGEIEDHIVIVNVVLPAKLVSFDAAVVNCSPRIAWTAAIESNFNRYEVERSTNGRTFSKIGQLNGKGNNSSYSFTDDAALPGTNFYRLKIIDWSGFSDYSATTTVNIKCNSHLSIRPTVTTGSSTITGLTTGQLINIYNMNGQLVTKINASASSQSINLSHMAAGTYKVLVSQNGTTIFIGSIIKQ